MRSAVRRCLHQLLASSLSQETMNSLHWLVCALRFALYGRLRRQIPLSRHLYTVPLEALSVLLISEKLCSCRRISSIECTLDMLIICLFGLSRRCRSKTRMAIGYGRHALCQSVEGYLPYIDSFERRGRLAGRTVRYDRPEAPAQDQR